MATTPPIISEDCFEDCNIDKAKLMVPKNSINNYKATAVWKDFGTIAVADGDKNMFINILLTNGQSIEFTLNQKPIIMYGTTTVTITNNSETIEYQMTDIQQVTMGDKSATGIDDIKADKAKGDMRYADGTFSLNGFEANSPVSVYDLSGRLVQTHRVSGDGSLSFSVATLSAGTYIVKAKSITYKFIKR